MTSTLIVLAHPDNRSFNGAWAKATAKISRELGHEVFWSDLIEMGFDPVERAAHYPADFGARKFDPLKAQETAARAQVLPPDVLAETDKLTAADRVIFHFPLWWFAPPAILKGWFDRVLVHGEHHDTTNRFDRGKFRGRKALFCVTTGSRAEESAFNGREGDVQMLLWPAAYTLRYLGFTVLLPEVIHGVHGYHKPEARPELEARLSATIQRQRAVLEGFDDRTAMAFNRDEDFGPDGRLLPGRPVHSPFIRHTP